MKKSTATLITNAYKVRFKFYNVENEEIILLTYRYFFDLSFTEYKGIKRKIFKDKTGYYFLFNKHKVRLKKAQ